MPLKEAVEYVAAAYIFVFTLLLVYLLIMSKRLRTVQRDLGGLRALAQARLSEAQAKRSQGGQSQPLPSRSERDDRGQENKALAAAAHAPTTEGDLGRPESSIA